MQLTLYTDYSLRVLIYLAAHSNQNCTVSDIAQYYNISHNHLVKVVHNLSKNNLLSTSRGKGGGLRLSRPAEEIHLKEVIELTEPNFHLVECFNSEGRMCSVEPVCKLKGILYTAIDRFFEHLDQYTIADLIAKEDTIDFVDPPIKQ